ncbi:MAG: hypothetical protein GOMPHAMPRED_001628 [Gomphillus americanus]|uniref:Uncharacterized protein n=1 Tax=Gomphillus americanus TaxID=1940652 RepID=A0A8H3F6B2_9LECA|nr:MAG: hypothetical protein GOMPHAMPRED_001628 [Gomphillus americanus]
MQFSTLLLAAFASAAVAQDQASLSSFISAYSSFLSSLQANPTFLSQVEQGLASDPALIGTLQSIATAIPDPKALTAPPAFFTQLPSSLQPLFSSIFSAEQSLANQYGLLSGSSSVGSALSTPSVSSSISSALSQSLSSPLSSIAGGLSSAASSASTAATGSTTGGSVSSTGSSAGAAAPAATGVAAMGLAAGLIGGIAVLL